MMASVRWVLARTGIYVAVALLGVSLAGFAYSAVTDTDALAGTSRSVDNLAAWLHLGMGVAVLGGCLTLVSLGLLAPFRRKLSALQLKLTLLTLLLVPVVFIDLVGATPSITLGLLGMQCLYLIIVPVTSATRA
jgi:hypothetical protein